MHGFTRMFRNLSPWSPSHHLTRSRQLRCEALERRDLLDGGIGAYEWTEVNSEAAWSARAGLQVVDIDDHFYLMGGRTPLDPNVVPAPGASVIWNDVWASDDRGESWNLILPHLTPSHWSARAYFQAVEKDDQIFVLGGQDFSVIPNPNPFPAPGDPPFISTSNFFNDVWSSADGVQWEQLTPDAGWIGRAGLSSVVYNNEIYVLGGSFNDDPAIIGGPPLRVYLNDVWKSSDGTSWEQLTDNAPWAPRAGAQVVVKDDYIYLLGGEDGFTCDSGSRCPPYFNDVWRSNDGANWQLVTDSAAWPERPGHHVQVVLNQFVLFGGFGLSDDPSDPFKPSNPMDVWTSKDGAHWVQVSDSPWNATSPEQIKYDFDALVVWEDDSFQPEIYTFGGDRETFNFLDPTNYLNVDNDVWRFHAPVDNTPVFFSGDDLVAVGGTGRDKITFSGPSDATRVRVNGEVFGPYNVAGDLMAFGRAGEDVLSAHWSVESAVEFHGGPDADYLIGSGQGDFLLGEQGDDYINARRGDDRVEGGTGNDRILGQHGNDRIQGGPGQDKIWGGHDDDLIFGGPDNDRLSAGAGDDVMLGGDGDDRLFAYLGRNLMIGGSGRDYLSSSFWSESILVGGTTIHDANDQALLALLAEWSNYQRSLSSRVQNLTDGSGPAPRANGNFFLNVHPGHALTSSVLDDFETDYLVGSTFARNWFFVFSGDRIFRRGFRSEITFG